MLPIFKGKGMAWRHEFKRRQSTMSSNESSDDESSWTASEKQGSDSEDSSTGGLDRNSALKIHVSLKDHKPVLNKSSVESVPKSSTPQSKHSVMPSKMPKL